MSLFHWIRKQSRYRFCRHCWKGHLSEQQKNGWFFIMSLLSDDGVLFSAFSYPSPFSFSQTFIKFISVCSTIQTFNTLIGFSFYFFSFFTLLFPKVSSYESLTSLPWHSFYFSPKKGFPKKLPFNSIRALFESYQNA